MTNFDPDRLKQFLDIHFNQEEEFKSTLIPSKWIKNAHITPKDLKTAGIDPASIPSEKVTRAEVWKVCLDSSKPVLLGYIWAMAWGGQGPNNARLAWPHRDDIARVLEKIRAGGLSRAEAYDLFCEANIPHLGPSFFTKLLFFFCPLPNAYIKDQWTAKSINYLTKREVVLLGPHTPTRENTGAQFEEYCSIVEQLQEVLAARGEVLTGEQVERRLFSDGGRDHEAGAWRLIVRAQYPKKSYKAKAKPRNGESKRVKAERVFVSNPGLTRPQMIKLFVEQAGLTSKGASTYYHNIRKEFQPSARGV